MTVTAQGAAPVTGQGAARDRLLAWAERFRPAEIHDQAMIALGVQSRREITRTRIRARIAMAAQIREQDRYGQPPAIWIPAGGRPARRGRTRPLRPYATLHYLVTAGGGALFANPSKWRSSARPRTPTRRTSAPMPKPWRTCSSPASR